MRARKIYDYIKETPGNVNPAILKNMLDAYVESQTNELYDYDVDIDFDPDTDLLGKTIDELEIGVKVVDGRVYGTLYPVTNYTDFSGDPEEQHGYYLVLHFESDDADSIKVNGVTLDEDGIIILIMKNRKGRIKVELTKGQDTIVDYLDIDGLKYGTKPAPVKNEEKEEDSQE